MRSGSRSPRSTARSTSTQSMPREVGEHPRLRLEDLRGEHAAAVGHRRIQLDALEVAVQLLDGVDRGHPLDLDGHPAVLAVAAHEVDGADVGRPLAAHEAEALAAHVGHLGEQLLQVALDAVLDQAAAVGRAAHVVHVVGEHLVQRDLERVVALDLAHGDAARRLLDDRGRRRHPVQGLVAAGVGVHEHRPVGLDHEQPQGLGQARAQAAGVLDLAAGDDQRASGHRRPSRRDGRRPGRVSDGARCATFGVDP